MDEISSECDAKLKAESRTHASKVWDIISTSDNSVDVGIEIESKLEKILNRLEYITKQKYGRCFGRGIIELVAIRLCKR